MIEEGFVIHLSAEPKLYRKKYFIELEADVEMMFWPELQRKLNSNLLLRRIKHGNPLLIGYAVSVLRSNEGTRPDLQTSPLSDFHYLHTAQGK